MLIHRNICRANNTCPASYFALYENLERRWPQGRGDSAGCFNAHAALELYAEAFDRAGALDRFEAFASFHGPDYYRLPRNGGKVVLVRERWDAPTEYPYGTDTLVPLRAGEPLQWRMLPGD